MPIQKFNLKVPRISVKGSLFVATLGFLCVFFAPLSYDFAYSTDNCHAAPMLLPHLLQSSDARYEVATTGGNALYSTGICIKPQKAIDSGTSSVFHGIFGKIPPGRAISIQTPEKPAVASLAIQKPIAATKPLEITLTAADTIHTYELRINNAKIVCGSDEKTISCPLQKAKVEQGMTYNASLERTLNGEREVLKKSMTVRTLRAATVIDSSIKPDSTIYDKPKTMSFTLDKDAVQARISLRKLSGEKEPVATSTSIAGRQVAVMWQEDLLRNESYEMRLESVEAADGSDLADPYVMSFTVSGGPKVTSLNIDKTGVATNAQILVTFDQEINGQQNIQKPVIIRGGAGVVSIGPGPNQITVRLQNVAKCLDFSVSIPKGFMSKFDVPSEADWKFNARTICHSTESIGLSTKGRSINAYTYGNGATSVLYTGAIHGSEASSSYILQDFMGYLEAHAREIPADRRIVVVPTLNPDGFAANSRFNARNVNLNRNFATSDWKKDIKDTNGNVASGGGAEPMSESETKAIAALANRLRPRLVFSYHAVGSVVIANNLGHSSSVAQSYSSQVGYSNGTGASSEIFKYEITGTFDDWLAEKLGVPSVVVELGSYTYRNFSHHQNAMWTSALK